MRQVPLEECGLRTTADTPCFYAGRLDEFTFAHQWLITRGVTRPIHGAIYVAERIAQGDLTTVIEVDSGDEIGRLPQEIQAMQTRLSILVGEIRTSVRAWRSPAPK